MAANYKAVPFQATRHYDAVTDSEKPWDNMPAYDVRQTRYCIVSADTGEILDDAQGYGYKTAQKAYSAYAYKTRDKSKDKARQKRKRHIKVWMNEHKSFVRAMDGVAFEVAKGAWGPDVSFDAKLVKKLLSDFDLNPDFSAGELLRVWRNG